MLLLEVSLGTTLTGPNIACLLTLKGCLRFNIFHISLFPVLQANQSVSLAVLITRAVIRFISPTAPAHALFAFYWHTSPNESSLHIPLFAVYSPLTARLIHCSIKLFDSAIDRLPNFFCLIGRKIIDFEQYTFVICSQYVRLTSTCSLWTWMSRKWCVTYTNPNAIMWALLLVNVVQRCPCSFRLKDKSINWLSLITRSGEPISNS